MGGMAFDVDGDLLPAGMIRLPSADIIWFGTSREMLVQI
jgi:hypothetical protein